MILNRVLFFILLFLCLVTFALTNSAAICQSCDTSVSYQENAEVSQQKEVIAFASQSSTTTVYLKRSQAKKKEFSTTYEYSLVLLGKATTKWVIIQDPATAESSTLLNVYIWPPAAATWVSFRQFTKTTPQISTIPNYIYDRTTFSTKFDKVPTQLWSYLASVVGTSYTFFSGCDSANYFTIRDSASQTCEPATPLDDFGDIFVYIFRFFMTFGGIALLTCCCCCCCCVTTVLLCGCCIVCCITCSVLYTFFSCIRTVFCLLCCCCCPSSKKKKYYVMDPHQQQQNQAKAYKDMKYKKLKDPVTPKYEQEPSPVPAQAAPPLPQQQDLAPLLSNHNSVALNYSYPAMNGAYQQEQINPFMNQQQQQAPQQPQISVPQSSVYDQSMNYQTTHLYQPPQQYSQQYLPMGASSSSSNIVDPNSNVPDYAGPVGEDSGLYPNPYSINLNDEQKTPMDDEGML